MTTAGIRMTRTCIINESPLWGRCQRTSELLAMDEGGRIFVLRLPVAAAVGNVGI